MFKFTILMNIGEHNKSEMKTKNTVFSVETKSLNLKHLRIIGTKHSLFQKSTFLFTWENGERQDIASHDVNMKACICVRFEFFSILIADIWCCVIFCCWMLFWAL